MASAFNGTTPQLSKGGTSGTKIGMPRGTETATYAPLSGAGAGVPGPTKGGKPYASNSKSAADESDD